MRILIVGGGITGLAAAWEASQHGADVVVCEASDHLGGKVRTEVIDGCRVELGPDSIVAYRPSAMGLARELGIADQMIAPRPGRRVSLHARGKMRPIPDGMGMVLPTKIWPFVTTGILSWPDKFRALVDVVLPRRLTPGKDVAIGQLLRSRLGGGIVERFADPMVGGIYGASVDELSLDAVLPSLREQETKHRSLMLASIQSGRDARKRKKATSGPQSPFRAPREGMGAFVTALETQLRERGVEIHTSTPVSSLAELVEAESVDAIILAGGVTSSADLLRPISPDAAAALEQIPLGSTTVVTLCYDADAFVEPVTTQGWLEAQAAPISGVTVSSVKYDARAPEDLVLARAFVPARLGDLHARPDEEILAAVEPWVREHLGATREPRWHHLQRWTHERPTYTVDHVARVAAVEEAVERDAPHIRVAGSALHGVGVPDCIADGRAQARALLGVEEKA